MKRTTSIVYKTPAFVIDAYIPMLHSKPDARRLILIFLIYPEYTQLKKK